MSNKRPLPPPDHIESLAELARVLDLNPVRLQRRARVGLLDADKVGKTYITTLRRLVASWDRRGVRGPAPEPLPSAVILHAQGLTEKRPVRGRKGEQPIAPDHESVFGEGVPIDGVDAQAARRAHLREQTTARQAADRHLRHPTIPRESPDHDAEVTARLAELDTEMARIDTEHQTWLHEQGEADSTK